MKRALIVALREVRSYLQDKADLAFSLLLPIAIFALMYGAFGGQSQFHATAQIVNEDPNGKYSTILLERLTQLESLDVGLLSRAEADGKLERSDLLMVIYIPSDFSSQLAAGQPTQLIFKQRGNGGAEGQIVASIVRSIVEEMNQEFQVQSQVKDLLTGKNISPDRIEITVQKFLEREHESPLVQVAETTVGSSPDPVNQFLPGILTMFVLFAITLSAQTIVEERRKGTLERLLTTRLSAGQLFAGKFLAGIFRGFVQTLILLVLSYAVFQLFTPLSFLEALVIALLFAAAASALGLVIAAIARTPDQATWIAVLFTMVMVMLSGTFYQAAEGTLFFKLSKFSLNTYANDAFLALIAEGSSLLHLGKEIGIIAGAMVVGLVLSRLLFRAIPGGR
jgi:ABC-2 type transport system permease protein